mmetsp:Transcript_50890/g.164747  ORF Transcript_50890/g.164747 Transcript_50890/m.164747 type:complete len:328 (-) Transcript_50890:1661-2644(-)
MATLTHAAAKRSRGSHDGLLNIGDLDVVRLAFAAGLGACFVVYLAEHGHFGPAILRVVRACGAALVPARRRIVAHTAGLRARLERGEPIDVGPGTAPCLVDERAEIGDVRAVCGRLRWRARATGRLAAATRATHRAGGEVGVVVASTPLWMLLVGGARVPVRVDGAALAVLALSRRGRSCSGRRGCTGRRCRRWRCRGRWRGRLRRRRRGRCWTSRGWRRCCRWRARAAGRLPAATRATHRAGGEVGVVVASTPLCMLLVGGARVPVRVDGAALAVLALSRRCRSCSGRSWRRRGRCWTSRGWRRCCRGRGRIRRAAVLAIGIGGAT